MNTLKTVFDKITDKTELASNKVELAGSVDDIINLLPKVLKNYESFKTLHGQLQKIASQAYSIGKTLINDKETLDKDVSFFEVKAKELGIDPKSIPAVKEYYSKMPSINDDYLQITYEFMDTAKSNIRI